MSNEKPTFRILLNDDLVCETDWPPLAQAAWARATTDRNAAQHGGEAIIEKDGQVLARQRPALGSRAKWPDSDTPECTMHDVAKALSLLLKQDGWDAREIAEAMTAQGLPTSRARVDALRGSTQGKRTEATPAELVVMMHAVISEYKRTEG